MRTFKISEIIGENLYNINIGDKFKFIPEIKKEFDIGGVYFRCSEHQVGYVILKSGEIVLKLKEIM